MCRRLRVQIRETAPATSCSAASASPTRRTSATAKSASTFSSRRRKGCAHRLNAGSRLQTAAEVLALARPQYNLRHFGVVIVARAGRARWSGRTLRSTSFHLRPATLATEADRPDKKCTIRPCTSHRSLLPRIDLRKECASRPRPLDCGGRPPRQRRQRPQPRFRLPVSGVHAGGAASLLLRGRARPDELHVRRRR